MTTVKTITSRRSVKVTKKELAIWKAEFAEYGAKAAAERATGVQVQTIRNIVNKGRGLIDHVEKLRQYIALIKIVDAEIRPLLLTPNTAA
jgi:hypothetical protein